MLSLRLDHIKKCAYSISQKYAHYVSLTYQKSIVIKDLQDKAIE